MPSAKAPKRPRHTEGADADAAYRRRPRQSRGQRRVDLLLDAAATVIAEQGLHAATAEAIALRAHTAKGSLYQFFPNRDAVLAALALRYAGELEAVYDESFAGKLHSLSLARLIDRIVKPLAAFHDRNPAFRRVFAALDAPSTATGATTVQNATSTGASPRIRSQLFDSFVDRLDVLFAARNPRLAARDRRRTALVAAAIGQALLARRDHAPVADKKPILDELRRALATYLAPVLDAPRKTRAAATPRRRK